MGLGPLKTWSAEDVAGWLESVQLNKLAPLFRSNEGTPLAALGCACMGGLPGCSRYRLLSGWALKQLPSHPLRPAVTGNDLAGMTSADLVEHFGCSSWQVRTCQPCK